MMSADEPDENRAAPVPAFAPKAPADMARLSPPRAGYLTAALLTLWIIVLHGLYLFRAGPLWRDEAGTVDFAAMPTLGDIWHNLRYDNFPPLFVAVARVWTLAGLDSDLSYRALGFLVGMGTLAALWWCARKLGGQAPLLGLALYAANPVAIRVGDAVRPYGLGVALLLPASALIWGFAQNPGKRTLVWAALAAVLSVQCLYQNAVFVMAFSCAAWVVLAGRREWKTAWQTGIIGLAAALSLLPYCGVIRQSMEWGDIARREIHFDSILGALGGALQAPGGGMAAVWAGLLAAALGAAVHCGIRQRQQAMVYCGAVLLAGPALYLVFLWAVQLPPRSWYFLVLLAPAALMLDAILGGMESRRWQLGRAALSLILVLGCGRACYQSVQFRQSNIDLVAARLKASAPPGDVILVFPWYYGVSLQRHFDASRWSTVPPLSEVRIHRLDLVKKAMMTENPIRPLLDQMRDALRSGRRVWFVGDFPAPPAGGNPGAELPPYREGMKVTEDAYFSSWVFEITALAQKHGLKGDPVAIPVPGGQAVNPLENVSVVMVQGWKE